MSRAMMMGGVHHLQRAGSSEHEDGQQDVHHKVHGGDIVIVDDDPVGRLCGGFLMDINLRGFLGMNRALRKPFTAGSRIFVL